MAVGLPRREPPEGTPCQHQVRYCWAGVMSPSLGQGGWQLSPPLPLGPDTSLVTEAGMRRKDEERDQQSGKQTKPWASQKEGDAGLGIIIANLT